MASNLIPVPRAIETLAALADAGQNQYTHRALKMLAGMTFADERFTEAAAAYRKLADTAGNDEEAVRENILKGAKIIACSGYTNDEEKPDFLLDGKTDTKWCDVSQTPN